MVKSIGLTLVILFTSLSTFADARLLQGDFYRRGDVCRDAREQSGKSETGPRIAFVLLKTHLCDIDNGVCLRSLRTLTDPANVFLHENFVLYHTQFMNYRKDSDSTEIYRAYYESEAVIRKEWNKPDSNPEMAIVDLRDCKELGRVRLQEDGLSLFGSFEQRYRAVRELALGIPGVLEILGAHITWSNR